MSLSDQQLRDAVRRFAPELDPVELRGFMATHDKPEDEPDSHAVWAAKLLRERREREVVEHVPLETVTDALRRHDERRL